MKRFVRIAAACVVIVALMVDSVAACRWFSRRAYCRPCPSPCYSAPVVYSSCGMPGATWSPMPYGAETMGSPSTHIPWTQEMPGTPMQPTPADIAPSSPSDRPSTFREPPPVTNPMTQPQPPLDAEPMPRPPQDTPAAPESTRTAPEPGPATPESTPAAPDNPFDRAAAPPVIDNPPDTTVPPPADTAPMADPPALDDPFRSPAPPSGTGGARPAGATPADDNPFPPPAGGERAAPAADPFSPPSSAPTTPDPSSNPFGPPPGDTAPANPLTPRTTDTAPAEPQPPLDNPFGAPPASTGSTPADPFSPVGSDAAAPIGDSNAAPTNNAPSAPMSESNSATPPATDDPFAEPAAPRQSAVAPTPEPADAVRVWTDVTGKHQIRGRMKLILSGDQKVRILKETGKYTTVPFARLSEADRTFVAHHAIKPSALLAER